MRRFFLFFFILSFSVVYAQEDSAKVSPWKIQGICGFTGMQTGLNNWILGGENNISFNAQIQARATRSWSHYIWESALNTQFGKVYTQSLGWKKVADLINFNSRYGYSITEKSSLFFMLLADFSSQYSYGYNNLATPDTGGNYTSRFFAPAFLNMGAGIDCRPTKWFSVFLTPIGARMTFVLDPYLAQQDLFGIGTKNFQGLFGVYSKIVVVAPIKEKILIKSNLDLFTPYNSNFGNVIVDLNLFVSYRLYKYIDINYNMLALFDDRVRFDRGDGVMLPRVQMKQILGFGFTYKF